MTKTILAGESFSIVSVQDRPSGSKAEKGIQPHSVKRTSDGEVFSIGDMVTNGTKMKGQITGFNILEGQIFIDHTWSGVGMNLDSLSKIVVLPSLWQIGDEVSLTFPGNGLLKKGKIIKISFTAHSEPLYDVEVPFNFYSQGDDPETPHSGYARIHGLKEWHLRNPESPIADWM